MSKPLLAAALLAMTAAPVALPSPVLAQGYDHGDRNWQGDRDGNWDPSHHYDRRGGRGDRRLGRNDRVYRGSDGRYYCKRSNGTTGLVIGGVAGGVLGNVVGGGTLGTLLGAGGGALLGRSIDRGNVRCR